MKLKHIAAAAAMFVSGSAFAAPLAPTNLGALDNTFASVFGQTSLTEAFLLQDFYTFTIAGPGTVSGSIFSSGYAMSAVTLIDSANVTIASDSTPSSFSFGGLTAGSFKLSFLGINSTPLASFYGGSVGAVTTPVPEPETYALMLAGLGVIGFMASRRRQG
jgi:hypothetical protein